MTQLRELHAEFLRLKSELFGKSLFVILDETAEDTIRYNQLLGYFYPEFRTKEWINPAIGTQSFQICDSQEVAEAYELYYSL